MYWIDWYLAFTANSIYGVFPVVIISYFFFYILKKILRVMPEPYIFVGLIFFIYILTVPSYPRYKFEKDTIAQFDYQSEFKLVNKYKLGAFVEPLTLVNAPIGFFHFVSPVSQYSRGVLGYSRARDRNEFTSLIYNYGENPITQIIDADCSDKTISISEPVDKVFRYKVFNEAMNDNEKKIYCETDFSPQMKIFYCKFNILKDVKKVSTEELIDADKRCSSSP